MKPGLLSELRRRNVWRAAILYIGAAWALAQGISQLGPAVGIPPWGTRWFLVAAGIGFPFWISFAWLYELTPEGLKRESEVAPGESIARRSGHKLDMAIIGVLSVSVVLLLTDRFVVHRDGGEAAAPTSARSIAILPFENLSDDPKNEYFSDGIADDILTRLSRLGDLRVISRASVQSYKGTDEPLRQIAAELGVQRVLEGSVRRSGDRVRITAELVDAPTGRELWADSYDRRLSDIFEVQSDIAGKIAVALRTHLTPEARARVTSAGTTSPAAYDLFLRGLAQLTRPGRLDVSKYPPAIAYFRAALARDPNYAAADAGLSQAFRLDEAMDRGPRIDSALVYARLAIRADSNLPDGYVALGSAYDLVGDPRAEPELERAVTLDSSDAEAMRGLVYHSLMQDRFDEALRRARAALVLAPRDSRVYMLVCISYLELGDVQWAEEACHHATALFPDFPGPYRELAFLDYVRGRRAGSQETIRAMLANAPEHEGSLRAAAENALEWADWSTAREYLSREADLNPRERFFLSEARVARALGETSHVRNLLDSAEEDLRRRPFRDLNEIRRWMGPRVTSAVDRAELSALRGDIDGAVGQLQTARRMSPPWLDYWAGQLVVYEPLRRDPRFQEMVAEMRAEIDAMRSNAQGHAWYGGIAARTAESPSRISAVVGGLSFSYLRYRSRSTPFRVGETVPKQPLGRNAAQ